MNNKDAQLKLLEKILSSHEFSNSKIYQSYLTYLVECYFQGKEVKETTIAMDVFGKDASFNPGQDTIVRSHTYTLRKKLESYYYKEGKCDKYRLRIPKGHYNVHFVPVSDQTLHPKNVLTTLTQRMHLPLILILAILLIVLTIKNELKSQQLKSYQIIDKNDPIWSEYLHPDLPVLIIMGNHFFFDDYDEDFNQTISIRHPKINSEVDFRTLYPNKTLITTPEPYFPYHSIWSLPPILNILYSAHKAPIFRKSSDVIPQILDEYNIIFLGSIKTLYILNHTLLNSHFTYEILPHKVIYTDPATDSVHVYKTTLHSEGPNEDLVMALKLPGPANNSIFLITSYHSLGAPEIANYLTRTDLREDLMTAFRKKYGEIPRYFEVLFKVSGIDKTAYKTEILVFNQIEANARRHLE